MAKHFKTISTVKVSIDWENPVNRRHIKAYKLKRWSHRKIAKLYLMNKTAEQQFRKKGFVKMNVQPQKANPKQNTLVFDITSDGIKVQEALYIYVLTDQKLVYSLSE